MRFKAEFKTCELLKANLRLQKPTQSKDQDLSTKSMVLKAKTKT